MSAWCPLYKPNEKELKELFGLCSDRVAAKFDGSVDFDKSTRDLRCEDKIVGPISDLSEKKEFDYRPIERKSGLRRIILVLESPHRDEFPKGKSQKNDEPAPARGATGRSIRNHIGSVLRSNDGLGRLVDSGAGAELVLMNAIQWQCSLGQKPLHKQLRDEIFSEFWSCIGRKDFQYRLFDIYKAGDVILNCCTAGRKSSLRLSVACAIWDYFHAVPEFQSNFFVYSGNHPASWWRNDKYRKLEDEKFRFEEWTSRFRSPQ